MRILIAGDQSLFRDGMRLMLAGLEPQPEIVEASDKASLETLLARGKVDLVVLDLSLVGLAGVPPVKSAAGTSPLVVVSASEDGHEVRACIAAGATGFLPKSTHRPIMLSAIRLVMAGGVYIPPLVLDAIAPTRRNGTHTDLKRLLTERQIDVLRLLAEGRPNKEIARQLNLAEGTVRVHVNAVLKALNARNRTEAALAARETDLF